ncbi:hypothetical protein VTK73DRAFT_2303 [Phialemonium thermophilum]|uniref:Uncharacterized protein n=1 Tax=Phialemonium thermophilum TaxID=223376 RepID=A0ABR3VSB0_9PEZI
MPWSTSRALRMSRSFWPSLLRAMRRSSAVSRRWATFHSNPSWSLKNSRKAGSAGRSSKALAGRLLLLPGMIAAPPFLGLRARAAAGKHSWAKRPSTCLRPFLILGPSKPLIAGEGETEERERAGPWELSARDTKTPYNGRKRYDSGYRAMRCGGWGGMEEAAESIKEAGKRLLC